MTKRVDVGGMNDNATANQGTATATFVGASVGDAAVVYAGTNSGTDTCTTPSGWTVIAGPFTQSANTRGYLFGKTALTQTEITNGVGFVWSGTGRLTGSGMVMVGSVQGFATATEAQAAASSVTNAANTTSGAFNDCLIFDHARIATASTHPVATFPAAWTKGSERSTNFGTSPNYSSACGILTTPVAAGTSIGGGSTTTSPAATHIIGIIVELLAYPANVGSASARGDSAADSTVAAVSAGTASSCAKVTAADSSTQVVGAGAAQSRADASGASASAVAGSGSGSARGDAGGAITASTVGAGSGSARGDAGGAAAGQVVAAGSGSASSSAAGTAPTISVVVTGAGSAISFASGDATVVPGAEQHVASATATAGGVAVVVSGLAGSAAARGTAAGALSPVSTPLSGAAAARASAAGSGALTTTMVGLARARGSAGGVTFMITAVVGVARARATAAGIALVGHPRDIKPVTAQLESRWRNRGPADRYDVTVLDQWATRILEDL